MNCKYLEIFVWLFTLPVLASTSHAQDVTTPPNCVTNIDPQGTLYQGYFGVVAAPATLERVEYDEGKLEILPSIRYGLSPIVGVLPGTKAGPLSLKFYAADDDLILQCQVNVRRFVPERDSLKDLALGECPILEEPLAVGTAILPRSVRPFSEGAIAFGGHIDISFISNQNFAVVGRSEGVGQFVLVEDHDMTPQSGDRQSRSIASLMGLCPVQVIAQEDLETRAPLCLTEDQRPAALKVGEEVVIQAPALPSGAHFFPSRIVAVDEGVAYAQVGTRPGPNLAPRRTESPLAINSVFLVTARAAGSTDILVSEFSSVGAICRVTVE